MSELAGFFFITRVRARVSRLVFRAHDVVCIFIYVRKSANVSATAQVSMDFDSFQL